MRRLSYHKRCDLILKCDKLDCDEQNTCGHFFAHPFHVSCMRGCTKHPEARCCEVKE